MPTVQGPAALHAAAPVLHFEPAPGSSLVAEPAFQGPRIPAMCSAMPWTLVPLGNGATLLHYPGAATLPLLGLASQMDAPMFPALRMAMPTLLPQLPQPQANSLLQMALCGLPTAAPEPPQALLCSSPVTTALLAPSSPQAVTAKQQRASAEPVSDSACDEKTLKRKQANRDSARRSRLRREAQVGEIFVDVDLLTTRATELQEELERLNAAANSLEAHNEVLRQGIDVMHAKQPLPPGLRLREDQLHQEVCEANQALDDAAETSWYSGKDERGPSCSHTSSGEGA